MNDRQFFALLVPLSVMAFLGIPTLFLTTLGPELKDDVRTALANVENELQFRFSKQARGGTQQVWPLCTLAEEEALTEQLRTAAQTAAVESVIGQLWECWMGEKGVVAQQLLDSGTELMESGQLSAAARVFVTATKQFPDWVEASNKLATVYFMQEKLHESAKLCREVLEKKPHHFGAANGLVQVLVRLGNFAEAEAVASGLAQLNHRMGEEALAIIGAAATHQRKEVRNGGEL
jgi:tetratricopeptide (TPR) repeat protein